eukprot:39170-Chlamydomonas_euryale.AAC.4
MEAAGGQAEGATSGCGCRVGMRMWRQHARDMVWTWCGHDVDMRLVHLGGVPAYSRLSAQRCPQSFGHAAMYTVV